MSAQRTFVRLLRKSNAAPGAYYQYFAQCLDAPDLDKGNLSYDCTVSPCDHQAHLVMLRAYLPNSIRLIGILVELEAKTRPSTS
jgi:hypothetical protein